MSDPWNTPVPPPPTTTATTLEHHSLPEQTKLSFHDNFEPEENNASSNKEFAKLPDSEEYLEALQRKLLTLQTTPSLLTSLQAKRDAVFQNLLMKNSSSSSGSTSDLNVADELRTNALLQKLDPEKFGALTAQELVELLKADFLQQELEEEQKVKEEGDEEGRSEGS